MRRLFERIRRCKPKIVFHYQYGYGIWFGKYAFFRVSNYWLPIIVPRFRFNACGVDARDGNKIPDRRYYSWDAE